MLRNDEKPIPIDKLPLAALSRWLEQRWLADAVEQVSTPNVPEVHNLVGTGNTGALGGGFIQIPGLAVLLSGMKQGQLVVMEAEVQLTRTANTPEVFWVVHPASGGQTNFTTPNGYPGAQLVTTGTYPVSPKATYTVPADGNYTFTVEAWCPGGGGTAGSGNAQLMVFS